MAAKRLKAFQDEQGKWYRAYTRRPEGVIQRMHSGNFVRIEDFPQADGSVAQMDVVLCEDCWSDIPKYVDFPRGLVSPESDGDSGGNFHKHRKTFIQGLEAVEAQQKVLCLDCFKRAFKRVYPGIKPPALRPNIHLQSSIKRIEQPASELEFVGEPLT